MAKLNWEAFDAKYEGAIKQVAAKNDVDKGVGRDMLIKMICEPDDAHREEAIRLYGPVPDGIDHEEFKAAWHEVVGEKE